MIKRIFTLPKERKVSPQYLKIKLNYLVYSDISLFWEQGEGDAVISLIDKDMVIENRNADINELRLFVNLIRPNSIFSDSETLRKLNLPFESYSVMKLEKEKENKAFISDNLSSKDIYELLKKANFSLPIYEYFATDYCAKHN